MGPIRGLPTLHRQIETGPAKTSGQAGTPMPKRFYVPCSPLEDGEVALATVLFGALRFNYVLVTEWLSSRLVRARSRMNFLHEFIDAGLAPPIPPLHDERFLPLGVHHTMDEIRGVFGRF